MSKYDNKEASPHHEPLRNYAKTKRQLSAVRAKCGHLESFSHLSSESSEGRRRRKVARASTELPGRRERPDKIDTQVRLIVSQNKLADQNVSTIQQRLIDVNASERSTDFSFNSFQQKYSARMHTHC